MEGASWGGSELLWSQAATNLASMGHQVAASVKHWQTKSEGISKLEQSGGLVHFRRPDRVSALTRLCTKVTSRLLRQHPNREMQKWLCDFKPDLVCVSDGAITGGLEWLRCCMKLGIPYVAVGQANYEDWWPDDERADLLREVFLNAERVCFVSRANRDLFERQLALSLPNAEIVWNPFNVGWHAAPAWQEAENGVWDLACVGRLHPPSKGQDLIIQMLALPHWRNVPLRVTFYGSGNMANSLMQLVAHNNIGSKVRFGGHLHSIENLWSQHSALILASRYEGLPLAVVEAMLCQRIAIVTAVAGNPEIIANGETGFIAAAPTVNLLDAAMSEAWSQRNHWQEMGRQAGISIRQKIPQDPGFVFANRLLEIASGKR